jgi:hypothetical protein
MQRWHQGDNQGPVEERKTEDKKKGCLKIHAAANVKSKKASSMKATNEHLPDGKVLPEGRRYCKIK